MVHCCNIVHSRGKAASLGQLVSWPGSLKSTNRVLGIATGQHEASICNVFEESEN